MLNAVPVAPLSAEPVSMLSNSPTVSVSRLKLNITPLMVRLTPPIDCTDPPVMTVSV